jgi:hypothetical protein
VNLNEIVWLDGRDSFDPDGDDITYRWSVLVAPDGARISLTGEHQSVCTLDANTPGLWVAQLVVSDGEFASEPAIVYVRVHIPPDRQTDIVVTGIRPEGLYNETYIDTFAVRVEN